MSAGSLIDFECLEQLTNASALRAHLVATLRDLGSGRVVAGLALDGRFACASFGGPDGEVAGEQAIALGCCAKLLTIALARTAIEEGRFALDSEVAGLLGVSASNVEGRLCGIRVRQLLEHMHGLDGGAVLEMPRLEDGFIDVPALCQRVTRSQPIVRPGAMYAYNNVGAWLAAACLERCYATRYEDLLASALEEFGVDLKQRRSPDGAAICPALGHGWTLPARAFMKFLAAEATRDDQLSAARCQLTAARMPGWTALEDGVTLGWNHYAGGWLGHNSLLEPALVLVRIHPERRIAVLVVSSDYTPGIVAARLFGRFIPDLLLYRRPSLVAGAGRQIDGALYVGIFGDECTRIEIAPGETSPLQLSAYVRQCEEEEGALTPIAAAPLIPAANHLFLILAQQPGLPSFVQFIEGEAGEFAFLWNGRSLWRRM